MHEKAIKPWTSRTLFLLCFVWWRSKFDWQYDGILNEINVLEDRQKEGKIQKIYYKSVNMLVNVLKA